MRFGQKPRVKYIYLNMIFFSSKMLVNWLRFIFKCQPLIELYYQPWSYVAQTGKI